MCDKINSADTKLLIHKPFFQKIMNKFIEFLKPINSQIEDKNSQYSSYYTSKLQYLEIGTFYKMLLYAIFESHLTKEFRNKQLLQDLSEALALAEISTISLHEQNTSSSSNGEQETKYLFGLNNEEILAKGKGMITSEHLHFIKQALQMFIAAQSEKILQIFEPKENIGYTSKCLNEFSDSIVDLQNNCASKYVLIIKQRTYNTTLIGMVYKLLNEYGNVLENLASKCRFTDNTLHHISYITLLMKAYLLKVRCVELEILNNTYNSSTAPALQLIDKQLNEKLTDTKQSLLNVNYKLDSYKELDYKFHEMLKEYSRLVADIEFFKNVIAQKQA